jgi:ribonuclease E
MNEHNDDHWKELTADLGISADENAEKETPLAQDAQPPVIQETPDAIKPVRPPRKPRCTSDWNGLASQLGLPTPEPVDDEPAPARTEESLADTTTQEPLGLAKELERTDEEERPVAASFDILEPDEMRAETVTEEFFEEVFEVRLEAEAEADDAEASGEEESGEEEEEPRTRRRRGRRRRRGGDRSRAAEPAAEEEAESNDDEADEVVEVEKSSDEEDESENRSRRRRRRRRRPSKRDSAGVPDEQQAAAEEVDEDTDDEADEDADIVDDDEEEERPRRRRRSRAKADSESRDSSDSDEADVPSRKHRKIPTWDEAIDLIVSGNLGSRSKSPSPKSGPRGSRRRGRRRS